MTLDRLLENRADPAKPFVTYYDLDTGERTELSATTTLNWVAKTANFLVDELDAERGASIRMTLPSHWQSYVWFLAAWRVGCVLTDGDADILISGPDTDPAAGEEVKVALSLRPLGAPFVEPPTGYLDYNAEVLSHGDHFMASDPPTPQTAATNLDGFEWTHQQVIDAAQASNDRRLVLPDRLADDVRTLVAAAVGNGSLVLVRGGTSEDRDAVATSERTIVN